MAFTPSFTTTLFILATVLVVLPTQTYAFGAGDIPDFSYLNDKAFRHGDIENVLEELVKSAGGVAAGGGLLSFAKSMLDNASGGAKFSKGDVKKVYFGNWLRDYSQAMDIAGLSKLSADTLILILSILGFMTFGYATEEFEVTADRVGVYLPVEHIDNPKGYGGNEDPRNHHPKLRPPVEDRELEIDHRNGMKKYMATEDEGFDSSTALLRRVFRSCIEHGRSSGGREGADLWEAYRLLGTGLHTLEDLLAHSNWCEIALRKMGHSEVFCHVGDDTDIDTPNGRAPPLVTGTFGGADFMHSMLGEATDKLSSASVSSLVDKMNDNKNNDASAKISQIRELLSKFNIGGGTDEKLDQGEQLQQESQAYHFDPNNVAPPDVQQKLLDLLKWRDSVFRDVSRGMDMIPGLADLMEELTNALNAYVYTVLAPYLTPILTQVTGVLGEGSKAVIDSDDQFEVFNNPNASDPSHSLLSKDHFGLILNEPAGKIAQVVVRHSAALIVQAWSDDSDPDQTINTVLEAFHHPYFADGQSRVQHDMFEELEKWFGGLGPEAGSQTIQALTKESVREGKNKRFEDEEGTGGGHGHSHGGSAGHGGSSGGYGGNLGFGGYGQQQSSQSYGGGRTNSDSYGSGGDRHEQSSYGRSDNDSYGSSRRDENSYGSGGRHEQSSYGRSDNESYGSGRRNEESSYGRSEEYGGSGRHEQSSYGRSDDNSYGSERHEQSSYGRDGNSYGSGRHHEGSSHGRSEEYGSGRLEQSSYGRNDESYGAGRQHEESSYGRSETNYGSQDSYGSHRNDEDSYGSRRNDDDSYGSRRHDDSESYGSSGRHHEGGGRYQPSYAGGYDNSSGGGYQQESSGYDPSYGGSDETYGAERLNIRDEGENRHGHHGSRRNEYDSGY